MENNQILDALDDDALIDIENDQEVKELPVSRKTHLPIVAPKTRESINIDLGDDDNFREEIDVTPQEMPSDEIKIVRNSRASRKKAVENSFRAPEETKSFLVTKEQDGTETVTPLSTGKSRDSFLVTKNENGSEIITPLSSSSRSSRKQGSRNLVVTQGPSRSSRNQGSRNLVVAQGPSRNNSVVAQGLSRKKQEAMRGIPTTRVEAVQDVAPLGTNDLIYYDAPSSVSSEQMGASPVVEEYTIYAEIESQPIMPLVEKKTDYESTHFKSPVHSLSWRQQQLVKKSLSEIGMYEKALQLSNVQLGFPLYPIFANRRDRALLTNAKLAKNDYFAHMLEAANSFGQEWKKGENKSLADKVSDKWRLPAGNPFNIMSFGKVIGTLRKRHPTRTCSVREIMIQLNPEFFHIPKAMVKNTTQAAIADIFTRPVVSETVWRKFISASTQKYSPKVVRQMIDSMCEPRSLLVKHLGQSNLNVNEISSILSDSANSEIRQLYDELRTSLMSTSNAAYVGSFITSLLGRAAALDWCPLFTKVFETVNGRSTTLDQDTRDIGIWQQVTISQMTKCFYRDVLVMHKELNAEMLMANLFQVVFGLDWAQSHIGFVHGNLDARGALRYCAVKPDVYLFYSWRGKYYRVPTFGRTMKLAIPNMEKSTISIDGFLDSRGNTRKSIPGAHLDLLRLGATLRVVLLDRTAKISGPSKDVITLLAKMLDSWSTCINEPGKTGSQGSQIDTLFLREKCIDETAEAGLCTWMSFAEIPKTLECPKAIPCNQQKFFSMFELDDVRKIPQNALVYTLL